ncbi:unnamed protein product [Amoebophrya sp. A120]|nr:unnamed protein product [Amoebophrya sp. A120]|eukprot:GSA120T00022035001.1
MSTSTAAAPSNMLFFAPPKRYCTGRELQNAMAMLLLLITTFYFTVFYAQLFYDVSGGPHDWMWDCRSFRRVDYTTRPASSTSQHSSSSATSYKEDDPGPLALGGALKRYVPVYAYLLFGFFWCWWHLLHAICAESVAAAVGEEAAITLRRGLDLESQTRSQVEKRQTEMNQSERGTGKNLVGQNQSSTARPVSPSTTPSSLLAPELLQSRNQNVQQQQPLFTEQQKIEFLDDEEDEEFLLLQGSEFDVSRVANDVGTVDTVEGKKAQRRGFLHEHQDQQKLATAAAFVPFLVYRNFFWGVKWVLVPTFLVFLYRGSVATWKNRGELRDWLDVDDGVVLPEQGNNLPEEGDPTESSSFGDNFRSSETREQPAKDFSLFSQAHGAQLTSSTTGGAVSSTPATASYTANSGLDRASRRTRTTSRAGLSNEEDSTDSSFYDQAQRIASSSSSSSSSRTRDNKLLSQHADPLRASTTAASESDEAEDGTTMTPTPTRQASSQMNRRLRSFLAQQAEKLRSAAAMRLVYGEGYVPSRYFFYPFGLLAHEEEFLVTVLFWRVLLGRVVLHVFLPILVFLCSVLLYERRLNNLDNIWKTYGTNMNKSNWNFFAARGGGDAATTTSIAGYDEGNIRTSLVLAETSSYGSAKSCAKVGVGIKIMGGNNDNSNSATRSPPVSTRQKSLELDSPDDIGNKNAQHEHQQLEEGDALNGATAMAENKRNRGLCWKSCGSTSSLKLFLFSFPMNLIAALAKLFQLFYRFLGRRFFRLFVSNSKRQVNYLEGGRHEHEAMFRVDNNIAGCGSSSSGRTSTSLGVQEEQRPTASINYHRRDKVTRFLLNQIATNSTILRRGTEENLKVQLLYEQGYKLDEEAEEVDLGPSTSAAANSNTTNVNNDVNSRILQQGPTATGTASLASTASAGALVQPSDTTSSSRAVQLQASLPVVSSTASYQIRQKKISSTVGTFRKTTTKFAVFCILPIYFVFSLVLFLFCRFMLFPMTMQSPSIDPLYNALVLVGERKAPTDADLLEQEDIEQELAGTSGAASTFDFLPSQQEPTSSGTTSRGDNKNPAAQRNRLLQKAAYSLLAAEFGFPPGDVAYNCGTLVKEVLEQQIEQEALTASHDVDHDNTAANELLAAATRNKVVDPAFAPGSVLRCEFSSTSVSGGNFYREPVEAEEDPIIYIYTHGNGGSAATSHMILQEIYARVFLAPGKNTNKHPRRRPRRLIAYLPTYPGYPGTMEQIQHVSYGGRAVLFLKKLLHHVMRRFRRNRNAKIVLHGMSIGTIAITAAFDQYLEEAVDNITATRTGRSLFSTLPFLPTLASAVGLAGNKATSGEQASDGTKSNQDKNFARVTHFLLEAPLTSVYDMAIRFVRDRIQWKVIEYFNWQFWNSWQTQAESSVAHLRNIMAAGVVSSSTSQSRTTSHAEDHPDQEHALALEGTRGTATAVKDLHVRIIMKEVDGVVYPDMATQLAGIVDEYETNQKNADKGTVRSPGDDESTSLIIQTDARHNDLIFEASPHSEAFSRWKNFLLED